MKRFFAIAMMAMIIFNSSFCQEKEKEDVEKIDVLVFTKTKGYRHQSISSGVKCMWELALKYGWKVTATEDASLFNDDFLSKFDVVVWLNTSKDVLDEQQQAAFERYYKNGHGFVGIHSAADTEYEWEWYGKILGGAWFKGHPPTQLGTLHIESTDHPSMQIFKEMSVKTWTVVDEWYAHKANPRPHVNVLITMEESSIKNLGENSDPSKVLMQGDHPMAWFHTLDGGRAFYTNRGHTPESFDDPVLREHFRGGIEWAAGRSK